MPNYEYEQREAQIALRQMEDVRRASLADRKEAQLEFFTAMRDNPTRVGDAVGHLLNGNYGYGAGQMARRVADSPRMNREAALTQLVDVFEWQCPEDRTRQAWKALRSSEKAALALAVKEAIDDYEEGEE